MPNLCLKRRPTQSKEHHQGIHAAHAYTSDVGPASLVEVVDKQYHYCCRAMSLEYKRKKRKKEEDGSVPVRSTKTACKATSVEIS